MRIETYTNSKLIESREAVGVEWIICDAAGVETGREPLTAGELTRFQAEGKATPDEKFAADIAAATTVAGLKAALTKWIGG